MRRNSFQGRSRPIPSSAPASGGRESPESIGRGCRRHDGGEAFRGGRRRSMTRGTHVPRSPGWCGDRAARHTRFEPKCTRNSHGEDSPRGGDRGGRPGRLLHARPARLRRGVRAGHPGRRSSSSKSRPALTALEGVAMELEDCGFPTLAKVDRHRRRQHGLRRVQLGAAGRGRPAEAGHGAQGPARPERQDLRRPGARPWPGTRPRTCASWSSATRATRTAWWPTRTAGRSRPSAGRAMTRLDHNRAVAALAKKAGVPNAAVTNVTIWGNHSNTQFPDFTNAKIDGKPATEVDHRPGLAGGHVRAAVPEPRGGGHQGPRAVQRLVGGQRGHRPRQDAGPRHRGGRLDERGRRLQRASTACRPGWSSATPAHRRPAAGTWKVVGGWSSTPSARRQVPEDARGAARRGAGCRQAPAPGIECRRSGSVPSSADGESMSTAKNVLGRPAPDVRDRTRRPASTATAAATPARTTRACTPSAPS